MAHQKPSVNVLSEQVKRSMTGAGGSLQHLRQAGFSYRLIWDKSASMHMEVHKETFVVLLSLSNFIVHLPYF